MQGHCEAINYIRVLRGPAAAVTSEYIIGRELRLGRPDVIANRDSNGAPIVFR
jgi:hypothetical protein